MASRKWTTTVSPKYILAFEQALFQQSLLYLFTALLLDHHATNHIATVAIFAHWAGMVLIVIRRPDTPAASDLWFCRNGIVPVFVTALLLGPPIEQALDSRSWFERGFGRPFFDRVGVPLILFVSALLWVLVYPIRVLYRREKTSTQAARAEAMITLEQVAATLGFPVVVLPAAADSMESAIRFLVARLIEGGFVDATFPDEIVGNVLKQENLGSTFLGQSIAFAHANDSAVDRVVGILAHGSSPVPWEAANDKQAGAICLILAPVDRPGDYMRVLEQISQALRHTGP